jgi:holo-[acyl-carrier protein] synthase
MNMIIGIGVDIVDMRELKDNLQDEVFQRKVFTSAEMDTVQRYKNIVEHLAGKFAAKEAIMKALEAGMRQEVWFTQIDVLNDEAGKPYIQVSGEAAKRLAEKNASQIHVSISHSGGVAVAVVILES